jgi:transposase
VFADSAYAGEHVANATCITVQIVRKPDHQIGFKVHKRRWVVERFFAWIGRNRRFLRDVERLIASAPAVETSRRGPDTASLLWRQL